MSGAAPLPAAAKAEDAPAAFVFQPFSAASPAQPAAFGAAAVNPFATNPFAVNPFASASGALPAASAAPFAFNFGAGNDASPSAAPTAAFGAFSIGTSSPARAPAAAAATSSPFSPISLASAAPPPVMSFDFGPPVTFPEPAVAASPVVHSSAAFAKAADAPAIPRPRPSDKASSRASAAAASATAAAAAAAAAAATAAADAARHASSSFTSVAAAVASAPPPTAEELIAFPRATEKAAKKSVEGSNDLDGDSSDFADSDDDGSGAAGEDSPFPPLPQRLDSSRQYAPYPVPEQRILDLLAVACEDTFRQEDFPEILNRIKHYFFHREFHEVFGREEHLPVYIAQYLPMRCLAYYNLWSTQPLLRKLLEKDSLVIYCIGAGPGSEAVGLTLAREVGMRNRIKSGTLSLEQVVQDSVATEEARLAAAKATTPAEATTALASAPPRLRIHSQDLFDWESSLRPVLASLAIYAPLAYARTNYTFDSSDILDATSVPSSQFRNSHVVTMCFVLNELLSSSRSKAILFLDRLVTALRPGAFLVVVDSAGDFSQVSIGKGEDTDPSVTARRGLQQQQQTQQTQQQATEAEGDATDGPSGEVEVDDAASDAPSATPAAAASGAPATAAASASSASAAAAAPPKPRRRIWAYQLLDAAPALATLVSENSTWYRYPGEALKLKYPLKFENMRYFLRIYQKRK